MQYRLLQLHIEHPTHAQQHEAGVQLAQQMLSEISRMPPHEIRILYTENGKPYTDSVPLHFSISHTDGVVLCAVHTAPIGVDIERIRLPHPKTIERVCTSAECAYIGDDPTRFAAVWTRKEAYAKLTGKGIGIGLQTIPTADETALLPTVCGLQTQTVIEKEYVYSIIFKD